VSYSPRYIRPLVDVFNLPHPVDWNSVFKRNAPLVVEIGFGLGEVLVRRSKESPDMNFLGIEAIWERIYKALSEVAIFNDNNAQTITNLKILKTDARPTFQYLFAPQSIDSIYSLFPCPWPKKGHVKHRLFGNEFLRLLNNRLKLGGELHIVTDYKVFFDWVIDESRGAGFGLKTNIIHPQFNTKFERKWQAEGQQEFFEIKMVKEVHQDIIEAGETEMKTYFFKEFLPEKFSFPNKTGEISVIFKDFIYDSIKKVAVVMVLVAEEELNQYLRIVIYKEEKGWRLMRADGQNFFPTPGIAYALKLVSEAVEQTVRI
jgi:tRNA (guanine-N7-)-methyltransferase